MENLAGLQSVPDSAALFAEEHVIVRLPRAPKADEAPGPVLEQQGHEEPQKEIEKRVEDDDSAGPGDASSAQGQKTHQPEKEKIKLIEDDGIAGQVGQLSYSAVVHASSPTSGAGKIFTLFFSPPLLHHLDKCPPPADRKLVCGSQCCGFQEAPASSPGAASRYVVLPDSGRSKGSCLF